MSEPNPIQDVYQRALGLLALRAHSACELRLKLRLRKFDDAPIDAAIAQLQAEGWLSDAQFAQDFARHRAEQGFGPLKTNAELRQRGVAAALIPPALAAVDWARALQRALRGRPAAKTRLALARAARFLYQRGFDGTQVRSGLARLTGKQGDEYGDE